MAKPLRPLSPGERVDIEAVPGYVRSDGAFIKPHLRRVQEKVRPAVPPQFGASPYGGFQGHQLPSWMMREEAPEVSCRNCALHNWRKPGTCMAFPEGIPEDIAYGRVVHQVPYPGDDGITFEHWSVKVDQEQADFPANVQDED